jgi:hypothetical protein
MQVPPVRDDTIKLVEKKEGRRKKDKRRKKENN